MEVTKAQQEFRCESGRRHFGINKQGLIEVKCRYCARRMRRQMGYRVVVFHHYDPRKREPVATVVFKDATELLKVTQ